MTYFFETYGCQMNIAESAAIEQIFIARGWTKATDAQIADIVIINTCSVRATAENRIFGRLGYYAGLKAVRAKEIGAKTKSLEQALRYVKDEPKPLTLIVTGCMAQRLLNDLQKEYPFIDYVVGTYAKKYFSEIITALEDGAHLSHIDESPIYSFAPLSAEPGAFSTFVPIMHGCNNFCTYCIVPHVRGREISRPYNEIINELTVLSSYGVKEITLLGQNVNSYKEANIDFPTLLTLIENHLEKINSSIRWIRFLSSHPKDLTKPLIDVMAQSTYICHHLHLPVQHGSNKILQAMNRKYTIEHYLELISSIKMAIPDISLTTDIMLGFPGETEADFEAALQLMKSVRYENAFMYYFNPREGTPAYKMENQIPLEIKKERLQKIIDTQQSITLSQMQKRINTTTTVLVESESRDNNEELLAKTPQDHRVVFKAKASLIGTFATVKLNELSGQTFKGTALS